MDPKKEISAPTSSFFSELSTPVEERPRERQVLKQSPFREFQLSGGQGPDNLSLPRTARCIYPMENFNL